MRPTYVAAASRPALGGGSTGPIDERPPRAIDEAASTISRGRETAAGSTRPGGQAVVVDDLVELDRIARRGFLPSLPAGARVELGLLPADHPERRTWEDSVTRHASACGCEAAAVVLMLVIGALVAAYLLGAAAIGLPGAPIAVTWAVVSIGSVFLAKAAVAYAARRSLRQLSAEITEAAHPGSA